MRAVVADRGQVTIPKALRDRLGIGPKTVLEFREEHGKLVVEKVVVDDAITRLMGVLSLDRPTDEIVDDLRGGG